MPDVKVPVLGNVPKGGLFAGGLAVAGVAGYLIYKKLKKPATPPATGTTPGTTTSQYGYGGYGYGYSPYGYGGFGPYGGYGGQSDYYGYGYGAGTQGTPPITTNAQWSQAALAGLTAQGYAGQDVLGALGLYLTGRQVTTTQAGIVEAAIALEGNPPQPGPSGFPPGINIGQGGGGVGQVTGLKVTSTTRNSITVSWSPSAGATSYTVDVTTHRASQQVTNQTVTGTSFTATGLNPNQSYAFHVSVPGGTQSTVYGSTQR